MLRFEVACIYFDVTVSLKRTTELKDEAHFRRSHGYHEIRVNVYTFGQLRAYASGG